MLLLQAGSYQAAQRSEGRLDRSGKPPETGAEASGTGVLSGDARMPIIPQCPAGKGDASITSYLKFK